MDYKLKDIGDAHARALFSVGDTVTIQIFDKFLMQSDELPQFLPVTPEQGRYRRWLVRGLLALVLAAVCVLYFGLHPDPLLTILRGVQ